jgi:hypothetical protein
MIFMFYLSTINHIHGDYFMLVVINPSISLNLYNGCNPVINLQLFSASLALK